MKVGAAAHPLFSLAIVLMVHDLTLVQQHAGRIGIGVSPDERGHLSVDALDAHGCPARDCQVMLMD